MSTVSVEGWLDQHVEELREKLAEAEEAVIIAREEYQQVAADRGSDVWACCAARLTSARLDRLLAKQRLARAERSMQP